jgi:low affinity Fe/Cu permease
MLAASVIKNLNKVLFALADFLSKPPGFYWLLVLLAASTGAVIWGIDENLVNFTYSLLAIIITGVVLIQGYRDTAAIHAKLDEIIIRLEGPHTDVVGLEKKDPDEIQAKLESLESEAGDSPDGS